MSSGAGARRPPDPSTVRIPGPWTHRDVSANGIRLHVAESGDGPLVLLLHGFAEFWWSWRHQLSSLADSGFRVVAADLRGYGDSDKPPRGYDGWTLSGDIAGLIKALGEPRAHLVGHAWGGMLGWTVGALHPRLVKSVSAISAPHPLALREAVRRTALRRRGGNQALAISQVFFAQLPMLPERRLTADGALALDRLFTRASGKEWARSSGFGDVVATHRQAMLVPGAAHSALEYYRWAMRSQARGDGRHFAEEMDRRLRMPVLRIHGSADPYMLEATARASASWCGPRSVYRGMPGIGHFPQQEAPAEVSRFLLEFLRRAR
ncbi:MAG: alpha/beta fold hydrolase [Sciscionella sp.]